MPESDVSTQFAQLFRDKVAEGDLAWVRDHFQSGRLNFLRDHITTEERGQFASRLAKGDMPWLRQVLSRIDIPGVGPLSMAVGSATVVPSLMTPPDPATAIGFAPPTGEIPETMAQPPVVQSLGSSAPVPPLVDVPTAPAAPAVEPPVDRAEPTAQVEADTAHVKTTITKHKRPFLPIILAIAVVGAGLYWLLNRNNDSPTTSATTVKTATVTTKPVGSAGATIAAVATTAPAPTAAPVAPAAPVIETLQADGNHNTLLAALQTAGLTDALKNGGPYTVFAPTDEAFAQLPPGTLDKLLGNKDALTKVLLFHVASGNLGPAALKSGPLPSLEGDVLTIQVEGTNVIVNSVAATSSPQAASIYSIDKVLLPPNALPPDTAAPVVTTAAPTPAATAPATTAPPKAGVEKVSVFFNASSSSLTQEATVILKDVAKKIKAAGPKASVKITGYADNRGTPDNIALVSKERAQRVADYLVSLGVQADYKIVAGGALPGTDYDQARRAEIELG